jgi:osmotically-inducible protein OsmY
VNAKLIPFAVAASLAVFLAGCENVTYSAARMAGIGDTLAKDANPERPRDALLATRLADVLKSDPATSDAEIYVTVSSGHARLSGFVDDAAAKLRAGVLVSETDGIDAVDNRIILRYRADAERDPIGDARVYL